MKKRNWLLIFGILILSAVACLTILSKISSSPSSESVLIPDRESIIPEDAIKMNPEIDKIPVQLHSDEFEQPVPMPYPVNTKGAEDSAFIMPDGNILYVWFSPNNKMDVIEQSQDLVTGIYKFERIENGWSDAERIWLVEPGKPHLDGCGFFQDNKVWICGAREGFTGLKWLTSEYKDGKWSNPEPVSFNPEYEVGELHISNDGSQLFFHSSRPGGKGGLDIWVSNKVNGEWQTPENLTNVNSEYDEGWPALSPDENELWISKNYGLWRSKKVDGEWQIPQEIFSALAGEATLDEQGNVYFTHHYYEDDKMIEADIYVAYRK